MWKRIIILESAKKQIAAYILWQMQGIFNSEVPSCNSRIMFILCFDRGGEGENERERDFLLFFIFNSVSRYIIKFKIESWYPRSKHLSPSTQLFTSSQGNNEIVPSFPIFQEDNSTKIYRILCTNSNERLLKQYKRESRYYYTHTHTTHNIYTFSWSFKPACFIRTYKFKDVKLITRNCKEVQIEHYCSILHTTSG